MEESVMETITKMSELDDKNYFTIARVIENGKCVELHYNNGKASIEYGIKDEDNNWNDEVDTDLKWFRLDLTDDEIYAWTWTQGGKWWKIENKKLLLVEEMIREEKQKSKDKNKDKSL